MNSQNFPPKLNAKKKKKRYPTDSSPLTRFGSLMIHEGGHDDAGMNAQSALLFNLLHHKASGLV
ncbi:unnamed protein product, partial [Candidula unifasciata]